METYNKLGDNELLKLTRSGDGYAEEQLLLRYFNIVKICSRSFFLAGGDTEDLIQEGMLGLLSAIREYDYTMNASFKTYAEVCVKRRMYTAIKTATRKKHEPLNEMVSFDDVLSDEGISASDTFRRIPEEQVLDQESAAEITEIYARYLSKLETKILKLYLNGLSYNEIATASGKQEKSVDNAIQRIRRKLAQNLYLGDFSES